MSTWMPSMGTEFSNSGADGVGDGRYVESLEMCSEIDALTTPSFSM